MIEDYQGDTLDILIDQGEDDQFYKEKQLLPEAFTDACTEELNVRMQKVMSCLNDNLMLGLIC